jgi:hypothetical protein
MMRPGSEICFPRHFEAVPNRDAFGVITNGVAFSRLTDNALFIPVMRDMLTVEEDPLTAIELADLNESLEDLSCGRVDFLPGSLSDEEFLARLNSD